jgi:soluble lytic murein transglycosylase-like protein
MPEMHEGSEDLDKEWTMKKYIAALAISLFVASTPALAGNVRDMVAAEARRQGVPVGLAVAVAKAESNFKCSAVGRAGERGVMQIKPRTARGLGYKGSASGLNNCAVGILYGMIYLKQAYRKAGGNIYRAALLYNAGIHSKRKSSAYAKKISGTVGQK